MADCSRRQFDGCRRRSRDSTRTHNKSSPCPEEIDRQLTSRLADVHLAPTPRAAENLRAEGIADAAIEITGNTGIYALLITLDRIGPVAAVDGERRIPLTTHRRENLGDPMRQI